MIKLILIAAAAAAGYAYSMCDFKSEKKNKIAKTALAVVGGISMIAVLGIAGFLTSPTFLTASLSAIVISTVASTVAGTIGGIKPSIISFIAAYGTSFSILLGMSFANPTVGITVGVVVFMGYAYPMIKDFSLLSDGIDAVIAGVAHEMEKQA